MTRVAPENQTIGDVRQQRAFFEEAQPEKVKAARTMLLAEADKGNIHYPAMVSGGSQDNAWNQHFLRAVASFDLRSLESVIGLMVAEPSDSPEAASVPKTGDSASPVLAVKSEMSESVQSAVAVINSMAKLDYAQWLTHLPEVKAAVSVAVCLDAMIDNKAHDYLSIVLRKFYSADAAYYQVLELAMLKAILRNKHFDFLASWLQCHPHTSWQQLMAAKVAYCQDASDPSAVLAYYYAIKNCGDSVYDFHNHEAQALLKALPKNSPSYILARVSGDLRERLSGDMDKYHSAILHFLGESKTNPFLCQKLAAILLKGEIQYIDSPQYNFCAGHVYYHGLGVEKDPARAVGYFTMAAEMGHKASIDALRQLGQPAVYQPVDLPKHTVDFSAKRHQLEPSEPLSRRDGSATAWLYSMLTTNLILLGTYNKTTLHHMRVGGQGLSPFFVLNTVISLFRIGIRDQAESPAKTYYCNMLRDVEWFTRNGHTFEDMDDHQQSVYTRLLEGQLIYAHVSQQAHGQSFAYFHHNGQFYLIKANKGQRKQHERAGVTVFRINNPNDLKTDKAFVALYASCQNHRYFDRPDDRLSANTLISDLDLVPLIHFDRGPQKTGNCAPLSVFAGMLSHCLMDTCRKQLSGVHLNKANLLVAWQTAYPRYKEIRNRVRGFAGMQLVKMVSTADPLVSLSDVDQRNLYKVVVDYVQGVLARSPSSGKSPAIVGYKIKVLCDVLQAFNARLSSVRPAATQGGLAASTDVAAAAVRADR